ncbi:hypothetical protein A3H80_03695 [Candidatus Roizmanbacteria bacterium RIFCSPLOWO2_02_FULL_37_19]|uniref:Type II secretion system protein GspG C-terminal domain-containing protein n=1 Tax=Candidatus Roizmanbacteria bacterium RIFCSPHIGHO2_02_FULL_37_24 TaxID=1802037 RepID=A0A1F7GUY6_9BACT|nr:MAG: hypothetical protein A2862_01785 [Candidatus Roizmanbacteria bacterium RIFCSPHIGHO2_01_FULL_38_41]OGK22927.1 MAG: hypothetical protein A3C24_03645 [Candidatus Roizmanbacteria bacterium RIFCSPHIGHO2_02_FULL_37_24]OGK33619.1 MAG: hypothetical protein A3E10_05140 [Candidatus Roizmanbacteria bacterium RIFCSPHIGHO2_12_FULL_37_23]OGK44968.1 MAG: hypothetical protein A2956_00290 [Candidatus Roizmanbacteria bacterium RIFCSPLOWO2_01_FULL_37_57]OGK55271.1 MAG: hypothetical protein A3H80_03695 [Ca
MLKKLMKVQKGFTLVEILIVVALIAILAVIALITINPAEAQKRSRDAQRLKELGTLQGIVEQYIGDNISSLTAMSAFSTGGNNQCGTGGWHGLDLCKYANTVSIDPVNRDGEYTLSDGTIQTGALGYQIQMDNNLRYNVCARMESSANAGKLTSDGVINNYFEVYSSTGGPTCGF